MPVFIVLPFVAGMFVQTDYQYGVAKRTLPLVYFSVLEYAMGFDEVPGLCNEPPDVFSSSHVSFDDIHLCGAVCSTLRNAVLNVFDFIKFP